MGYIVEIFGVPSGRTTAEFPSGRTTANEIAELVDDHGVRFGDLHYSSSGGDKFRAWLATVGDTAGDANFAGRFLHGPVGTVTITEDDDNDFPLVGGVILPEGVVLLDALGRAEEPSGGDERDWQEDLVRMLRWAIERGNDLICITA